MAYLLVFAGAGLGATLRYAAGEAALRAWGGGFPAATLFVNVLGCFGIGIVAAMLPRPESASQQLWLFLAPGLLGGFTTFSAFGLETLILWQRGEQWAAACYVLASVSLSLIAVAAAFAVVRVLN